MAENDKPAGESYVAPQELDQFLAATRRTPWTAEECFHLNARQHDATLHPYTCGNDSTHRPLIATPEGWRCSDCDYRQGWAHAADASGETDEMTADQRAWAAASKKALDRWAKDNPFE